MTGNVSTGKMGRTRPRNGRPTIGLVVSRISDSNCFSVWLGVTAAAKERDANVITFAAHDLGTTDGFDAQANVLYDMISADVLDGIVAWAAPLVNYVGPEGANRVLEQCQPLPIVIIETGGPEDIPRVEIDSYQPMREMVTHLVKDHGYRRIAFIRGPDITHTGARDRYQGYMDALTEHGLPFDPDLVSPPTNGEWGYDVGETAISLFLDQRQVSLEAVVAVNDEMAVGAMQALEARGIHVPDEVAVTGFDDKAISNSIVPPLTTVSLQGYEHAHQATEMLFTLLDGGEVPAQSTVPFKLVIRQSCGCVSPAVAQAAAEQVPVEDKSLEAVVGAQRETILSAMNQAAGIAVEELDPGWAEQLLEAFFTDLKAETPGAFLSALDRALRKVMAIDSPVEEWVNVISVMRRCVLPYLGEGQVLRRASDLWLQAQVMVGENAQLVHRRRAVQVAQQTQITSEARATLATSFGLKALPDVLVQELPRLGIPSCYLALYEDPQPYRYSQPAPEWSRLVLAYTEQGRVELEPGGRQFRTCELVPEGVLLQERQYNLVVEPLYFQENQLGFILLEAGPREGAVYETLRTQISSTLQGALLMQQIQENTLQLDTVVAQTLATVQEMQVTVSETATQARAVADAAQQSVDVSQAGQAVVTDTVAGMSAIQEQVKGIEQDILALSRRTAQIGEIIGVVKRIADQSHLLALNANIEAARFGKQGQAFAVVAKEMRDLAGQSREATYRVRDILTEIQRATNTAVMVTREGSESAQNGMELASRAGEAIRDLSATIEKAAQAATHIASTTYQQTTGMNRLAEAMQAIKQTSSQTTASTRLAGGTPE